MNSSGLLAHESLNALGAIELAAFKGSVLAGACCSCAGAVERAASACCRDRLSSICSVDGHTMGGAGAHPAGQGTCAF